MGKVGCLVGWVELLVDFLEGSVLFFDMSGVEKNMRET